MPALPAKLKAELIDQVAARVRAAVPKGEAAAAEGFARFYYQGVAPDLLLEQEVETLAAASLSLWRFAQKRGIGAPKLRVYNPNQDEHGWSSTHTVVEIVNDDMPFIVDSVVASLNRQDLIVHLLIHPVIRVRRDKDGKLADVLERAAKGGADESVIHLEVNQRAGEAALDVVRDNLLKVLAEVRAAVEDWEPMQARMEEVLKDLNRSPPPTPADEQAEDIAFLDWMRQHNFTFLGARDYRLEKKGGKEYLRIVPGSGLGLLRTVTAESSARHDAPLTQAEANKAHAKSLLIITKATSRSTVHRAVYMDYIGVRQFDAKGTVTGERRFVGLFTSSAYSHIPHEIPLLRRKVQQVLDRTGFAPNSHNAKAIQHILETYPRDELFQIGVGELYDTAMGVLHLEERQRLRLFVRKDEYARFYSCLVYVPREVYSTELRQRMERILREELKGETVDFNTHISDAPMARVHYIVRSTHGVAEDVDMAAVEERLATAARRWSDDLVDHLVQRVGEAHAHELFDRYRDAFPPGYQYRFDAEIAVSDIERVEAVRAGAPIAMNLYRRPGATEGELFFKIFHADSPLALSDVLPMLEHMGLKVVAERPFEITDGGGHSVFAHDFEMTAAGVEVDLGAVRAKFQDAFQRIWSSEAESDGLNRLIMRAGFDWREVVILRTYVRYLRQVRAPYSQALIEDTLSKHAPIARLLVNLFEARLDPDRIDSKRGDDIVRVIEAALDGVTSLEEDGILRRLLNLICCTLRTNYFQRDAKGAPKAYLSVKLDSHKIDDLPLPRPMVEIFVYSARMEGVHLRGGKVARGGIRWSDRREDFRTEILGLMKAQMVKNAVIVPVGSKGGFVLKRPPAEGGREALQAEVVRCYQTLIRGMLDLTDNRKGKEIVPPVRTVRHDDDDPYLVVAADKGTATFSDVANALAREYCFWLDDAFASGGSAGYDHKEMAITARGGWVSVQRHFRELGVNVQEQEFTAVGVGDMSGDVFGNGALRSDRMKLVGAFNHLHIFVDPDPDPTKSFAERKRLFGLPRSSWNDYDAKLLSKGGAVYGRDLKSIKLSPEAKACFGITKDAVTPNELMSAILKARVDLIWFGGIGTYVKASSESHLEVGDRANDGLRVDGKQIRAKVIGEGANLGCTQRGRVEYALAGGKLNTDAIDNSGGVDCSDHEVNIKILLGEVVSEGDMTMKQRDALLVKMTEEVAGLVLKDNYQQTQAISIMEARAQELLDQQARMMASLEREGRLDRAIEYLPDEETIGRRRAAGQGLTRPEIAVMLAYGKIALYDDLLASNLPDDPLLFDDLVAYFPRPLHELREALEKHRLRREIIAEVVTNSVVNRVGASFVHDAQERTGLSAADVARAYTITRDAFDIRGLWRPIEKLDDKVPAALQIEMMRDVGRLIERSIYWFLRNGTHPLDVAATAAVFRPGITALARGLEGVLTPERDARFRAHAERLDKAGVPEDLARRVACLEEMGSACDLVRISRLTQQRIETAAEVYFALGARLGFEWLRAAARAMTTETAWQKSAVDAVIDDLRAQQVDLTVKALGEGGADASAKASVEAWLANRARALKRVDALLAEFRAAPAVDMAMLTVASRRLRTLAGG
ncbi:MAG: NAD-glutamate dehydrogenase [Alphaproteobacteria bacterium]